jgi:single-strand DNA-binding protein
MAKGVNKAILMGYVGADPEFRSMPSGVAVASISVATIHAWEDKVTHESQERTEWNRVILLNQLAERARERLRQGSRVYIEGRIQTRKWRDKNGHDRYSTEIIASQMQMLDSGSRSDDPGYASSGLISLSESVSVSQPLSEFDDLSF